LACAWLTEIENYVFHFHLIYVYNQSTRPTNRGDFALYGGFGADDVVLVGGHGHTGAGHPAGISGTQQLVIVGESVIQGWASAAGGWLWTGTLVALPRHLRQISFLPLLLAHRREVAAEVEYGAGPLGDQATGSIAIRLGLLGVFVQVHHSFTDARLLQQSLFNGRKLGV